MKINTRLCLIAGLTVLGMAAVAQQKDFRDENGTEFRATGWESFLVKRLPNKNISLEIGGAPVVAKWIAQRLELQASRLEMVATTDYRLVTAKLIGGITFIAREDQNGNLTVKAPGATYTESEQKLVVTGALTVDRTSGEGDTMHAEGKSGTIFLDRNSSRDALVKSANLTGPVTFSLKGSRVDEETKKKVPYLVKATADRLDYSDADRKAVLAGNVTLSGNDPTLFGEMTGVDKATIILDAAREIESIEFEGNPGKTKIEQRTGATGGGGAGGKRKN